MAVDTANAGTLRRFSTGNTEKVARRFNNIGDEFMLWLILEACAALFVLVFIVWWTMFSGRKEKSGPPAARPDAREKEDSGKE
ncbi:hypothetical protein [Herbaspirillum sp. SJZ099]|uniref:hypothetical protein n=1 Tax=Herbaspirillum sp. SJZ099 TaxID=2572916 RepID=UPI001646328E|nr:hypothetical protein [Herbaspirillum sp. SJZ099]